jgi:hypothetical protein
MAKDKLTDYDSTAGGNLDVGGISVAEGMLPSGVNNAIREQMSHLADFAAGTSGVDVLKLQDDTDTNSIKLQAPASVTTTTTFTLPDGDGASGQAMITDGAGTLSWAAPYGNRNLIINGAMQVAQRSSGPITVSDSSNEGFSTLDRWYLNFNATAGGALDFSQSTDAPDGFASSVKLACSTADASHTGTEQIYLAQYMEAQNLQQFGYGASSAKSMTISWYMKAVNFTGPISLALDTTDGTQEYYVVSKNPTSSWARYSVTIPGSSSATVNNDNGKGLSVKFVLAGDSSGTYAAASDSTAWSTTRKDYRNDIGNLVSSTSNEFYITGIQLELGDTATPFEHRSYGDELAKCQRYFYNFADGSVDSDAPISVGTYYSTTVIYSGVKLPVTMRAAPTLVTASGTSYYVAFRAGDSDPFDSIVLSLSTPDYLEFNGDTNVSGTAGHGCFLRLNNASAKLQLDAEL